MNLSIFVINLDKRPDRLLSMTRELQKLPSIPWTRVCAKECTPHDVTQCYHNKIIPSLHEYAHCLSNPGNLGCYLSHCSVLQQIADCKNNDNTFLVLEDDVRLSHNAEQHLRRIVQSDYDMVYLYIPPERLFVEDYNESLYKLNYGYEGLYAYMIRPPYAHTLLQYLQTFRLPIDHQIVQCNQELGSLILTPKYPFLWTDCSPNRNSDTLQFHGDLHIPLLIHTSRKLIEHEHKVLYNFHIVHYTSWTDACRGIENRGGFLLPLHYTLQISLAAFANKCQRFAFGQGGQLTLPFLAGIGLVDVEEALSNNTITQTIEWLHPDLVPFVFQPIVGT